MLTYPPGGGGGFNQTIEDEGAPVTQRTNVNFTGGGVSVADTGGKTTVSILGGSGEAFPVGSVFIAVVSTNPATLLGYGTWSAFGTGRMLIGLDSGDTDFDTAEETGGAKTHTLAEGNLPSHTHSITDPGHSHGVTDPGHVHDENAPTSASGGAVRFATDTNAGGSTDSTLNTASAVTGVTVDSETTGITATNATGSGTSVNHMPPFIAVYMWKRTA